MEEFHTRRCLSNSGSININIMMKSLLAFSAAKPEQDLPNKSSFCDECDEDESLNFRTYAGFQLINILNKLDLIH